MNSTFAVDTVKAPARSSVGAASLPTGTVTFLFSDIEGSTVRWERDPEAMQDALRRHDAIMRRAIVEADGHVFKTIGDAFCAVFWSPADALCAALAAQRALAAEDFAAVGDVRVRMAIHTGTTDERDADYFGPPVNRVARLLAIGHGGQVLFSGLAAELATPSLLDGVSFRDMGEHRLKDLTAPEHVYQLLAPDLPAEFPRLRSLSAGENNLPHQTTAFVGREHEIAEIERLLASSRLVTLFGAGGIGKTRCALHVGADLLDGYHDGVWFVDFAPLSDPSLVASTIASVFDVQEAANKPMIDTLVANLRPKKLLLILDNCEHVIEEAARAASALLRGCAHMRIIATSREALKVDGESVYRLPSLEIPELDGVPTAEKAIRFAAVELFVARARAANAKFLFTDENAPFVVDICRRLDGIPLAIELAAARTTVLAPKALAQKLDERFRVLTGGSRTALPRQQTMRALIDWSYELLNESERGLLNEVAIFSGGFTIEAAIATCASETVEDFEILDLLTSLVEKSMVLAEPSESETRYRMLESIRQYACEKLKGSGVLERVAARHAVTYKDFAETLEREYDTLPTDVFLDRAEPEIPNLRDALTWSFAPGGDVEVGQSIAATLDRIFGPFVASEARRWVKRAITAVAETTPAGLVGRLEVADAQLASILSQHTESLESAESALAAFTKAGDEVGVADAQRWVGRAMILLGRLHEGETLLQRSLVTHRMHNSKRAGGTLRDLGYACGLAGDASAARRYFAEALQLFTESADRGNAVTTAASLAEVEYRCGDAEKALRISEEALEAARGLRRYRIVAGLLTNISAFLIALGRCDEARERARESLEIARRLEAHIYVTTDVQHLAAVAAVRCGENVTDDDARLAARLLGYVDARFAALGYDRESTEQHEYESIRTALRSKLGDEAVEILMKEGAAWKEDRAMDEALRV